MNRAIKILLISIFPIVSFSQDAGDALFAESLTQMSKSKELRDLIGTVHQNRNAMFFYYGNLKYTSIPEESSEYSIYLCRKVDLFDKPVSCYMNIDSLGQKGNNIFVYFKITGEGNEPCVYKKGLAKFKNLGDAKLELTKLQIK